MKTREVNACGADQDEVEKKCLSEITLKIEG